MVFFKTVIFNKKGQAAVLAIAIMIVLVLFNLVALSIFTSINTSVRLASAQQKKVKYIARAILMYYLQFLRYDWNGAIALVRDQGFFNNMEISITGEDQYFVDIEVNYPYIDSDNRQSYQRAEIITRARMLSTGIGWKRAGRSLTKPIEYSIRIVVDRLPRASLFSLFWGRGPTLQISNNSSIVGDMYAAGSVSWVNNSFITAGRLYHPAGTTISGTGCQDCNYVTIDNEYPFAGNNINAVPPFDAGVYTDTMNSFKVDMDGYDGVISASSYANPVYKCWISGETIDLTGQNYVCNSGDFSISGISGTVNINGFGNFIAKQGSIKISGGNVTISPSPGGTINFLAKNNIEIGSNNSSILVNPQRSGNVVFYSGADAVGGGIVISNPGTNIKTSRILSRNKILVSSSAKVTDSTLYSASSNFALDNYLRLELAAVVEDSILLGGRRVEMYSGSRCLNCNVFVDRNNDTINNSLIIQGTNTFASGSFISLSLRPVGFFGVDSGLDIRFGPEVRGLVYHDGADVSRTNISECTIKGSLIASLFTSNSIDNNVLIIYDNEEIINMLSNTRKGQDQNSSFGFNQIVIEPNSWIEPYFKHLKEYQ